MKYNDLVAEFSLQLSYEPIAISANGVFKVDLALLGTVSMG